MFGFVVGYSGSGIEWRYFRFDQIQYGGSATILENSNGNISATDHPIHTMVGSRVGFSGSADLIYYQKLESLGYYFCC